MGNREDVLDKVIDIVAWELCIVGTVSPEDNLRDDLGADSLGMVELVMCLGCKFGIEIPDAEGDKVKTVSDLVELVMRMVGNGDGLEKELAVILNRVSRENKSNTPDFILAEFMLDCLVAGEKLINRREGR